MKREVNPKNIRNPKGHVESLIEYRKKGGRCWLYGTKGVAKPNSGSFKKGLIPWHKGKTGVYSPEMIEKLRLAKLGKRGKDTPRWKGGDRKPLIAIRGMVEYKVWRLGVFERDKFTCLNCGCRGGKLHVHHLVPLKTLIEKYQIRTTTDAMDCAQLWEISNGITICAECHGRYHHA